jgi:hypothetical protein
MAELTLAIQAKDEGEILTDDLNQPKEKEEFFKMLSEVAKEMAFKIDLERN